MERFNIRCYFAPNTHHLALDSNDVDSFLRAGGGNDVTFGRKLNTIRIICDKLLLDYPYSIMETMPMLTARGETHELTITFDGVKNND